MIVHVTRGLYYFEIHLLYASMVALAAWLLTSLRAGDASTKYWIWVATSLNFVVPTGAFFDRSFVSHLTWAAPLGVIGDLAYRMTHGPAAVVILSVWLIGAVFMLVRLGLRLRYESFYRDKAAQVVFDSGNWLIEGVPLKFAAPGNGPAVDGILHPQISLPHGIDRLLSEHELKAVLIHELKHAKRHDNLLRLIHEVILCILWFHPLLWIAGSRLALFCELSCDEPVVQSERAGDLISALAKLANPASERHFMQATLSSFVGRRLARLTAGSRTGSRLERIFVAAVFIAALLAGTFATVAHTACCFVARN